MQRINKRQRVAEDPSAPSVAVDSAVAVGPAVDRERALQDARCAVVCLATSTALETATSTGVETATATSTALNKLLTAIERALASSSADDWDAPALWVSLVHAWLSVAPGTPTSERLLYVARRVARALYPAAAGAAPEAEPEPDPAAVAHLHKVLTMNFREPWRGMMQRLLSERVFWQLTTFREVSVGVLARGMSLDAALCELKTLSSGASLDDAMKGRTFVEAVRALECAEGGDAQLAVEGQLEIADILLDLTGVAWSRALLRYGERARAAEAKCAARRALVES